MQVNTLNAQQDSNIHTFRKHAFKNHEDFSQVIMRPRQRQEKLQDLCVFEIVGKKELWSIVSKTILTSLFFLFFVLCCSFSNSNHFSFQHSVVNNYFPFCHFYNFVGEILTPTLYSSTNLNIIHQLLLSPKVRKNMVFFFLRFSNMLKTRKRSLSSRGYQWINVMVSLFGQVAKNKKCLSHIKSCMFT